MSDAPSSRKSTRLLSLDVLRGMTIAGMILVNNPGDGSHVYAPLRHADWNGWTPTRRSRSRARASSTPAAGPSCRSAA